MSIAINSNFERDQYVASFTGQVNFVYSFPIFSDTYLTVYKYSPPNVPDDPTQKLTLGVDYTVTGVGEAEGGTIILNVGATIGDIITVVGTQPIDRESVFQDLNPFTVALNQQLNELTVMTQQSSTYWFNITPRYNFDELVSTMVRPFKLILPMLPDGHVWVGRGELGEIPDDIVTAPFPTGGGVGNVIADHPGMRPSIALWTGTDFVLTDSNLNISGDLIIPTAGSPANTVTGFDDSFGAMHWPAHPTADRPLSPNDGDTYYDTDLNQFYGYVNGMWQPFGGGGGGTTIIVDQPNTFTNGQVVMIDPNTNLWVLALADTAFNAEAVGFVVDPVTPLSFGVQQAGVGTFPPSLNILPGIVYWLSDTLAGVITDIQPITNTHISKPMLIGHTTANQGWILPYRGKVIGGGAPFIPPTGIIQVPVYQPNHGFIVGNAIYIDATDHYALAQSDVEATSLAVGLVVRVIDTDNFILQTCGFNNVFTGLSPTERYWLSDVTPGLITTTKPTTPGHYLMPMLYALNDTTGYILEQTPELIPTSPGGNTGIIQVKSLVYRDYFNQVFTGGSYQLINNFNVTITPSDVNNKIKIEVSLRVQKNGISGVPSPIYAISRNGVLVPESVGMGGTYNVGATATISGGGPTGSAPTISEVVYLFVDEPNTTSAITYGLMVYTTSVSFSLDINRAGPSFPGSGIYSRFISVYTCEEFTP